MIDNKLIDLYLSLNGVEKRECAKFLQSPFFNQRDDVGRLWRYLGETQPKPGEVIFTKKRQGKDAQPPAGHSVFSRVFPGESFDAQRWRHVQSFLVQHIEAFLAQRAYEQSPVLADLHLAPVYRQKNLHKHLDHLFRRAEQRLARHPRDNAYYHTLYQLEWEKYAAVESHTRMRATNLAAVGRALDIYLAASKLRLACLMESHRAVFNIDYDLTFLPGLLHYLETSDLREAPLVALYYHCYRALTAGGEADFHHFRQKLEEQHTELPADERRTFLLLAVNYCIRQLNAGQQRYIREALDLYRVGLTTGVLLENERLGRFAYKNIVALGLKLEDFGWVEDFITRYEPQLEEKYRAATRDYNLARLHFARKDYHQAMPLLARVDESDLLLSLDSRIMLLKMYYETGEWDALDALMASFKIRLLRKKKVIGYHQTHYLNTLRYIHKLIRLHPNDAKSTAALRYEITNHPAILEKDWLLQRLDAGF